MRPDSLAMSSRLITHASAVQARPTTLMPSKLAHTHTPAIRTRYLNLCSVLLLHETPDLVCLNPGGILSSELVGRATRNRRILSLQLRRMQTPTPSKAGTNSKQPQEPSVIRDP